MKIVIATSGTVGMAEWIIDDIFLVDPRGRPQEQAGSDYYFYTECPSARPSVRQSLQPRLWAGRVDH